MYNLANTHTGMKTVDPGKFATLSTDVRPILPSPKHVLGSVYTGPYAHVRKTQQAKCSNFKPRWAYGFGKVYYTEWPGYTEQWLHSFFDVSV